MGHRGDEAASAVAHPSSHSYTTALLCTGFSQSKAQLAAKVAELETQGRAANRLKSPDSPVPLRFDPELGMNIYSVDSLKIGKGGDTALCPFDCDCCF